MVLSSLASKSVQQVGPNAGHELLPEAGARYERTLEAVGSMPWLDQNSAHTIRNVGEIGTHFLRSP
jgi:hypothetical protein